MAFEYFDLSDRSVHFIFWGILAALDLVNEFHLIVFVYIWYGRIMETGC
jgi:hypothetical protein